MQKHIDATKVVRGDVNFLTVETLTYIFLSQNLGKFEQQRTRAASRIIDLTNFGLAHDGQTSQKL